MLRRLICYSVAVPNIEEALPVYTEGLGFKQMTDIYQGERGYGLRVVQLGDGNQAFVELLDSPEPGPVQRFLERKGPGLYQVRFETDRLYDTVKELQGRGVEVILPKPVGGGEPPKEPDRDISIAFVHPKSTSGVLMELYPSAEGPK